MLLSSAPFRRAKKHRAEVRDLRSASGKRESAGRREEIPEFRNYSGDMPPARPEPRDQLDLRRVRFGAFVARTLDAARGRGLSVTDIEKATGLGNSTFYSWAKGEWNRDPVPARVQQFCDGLGASVEEAYRALGWTVPNAPKRAAAEPLIDDPDLRLLFRKLSSPNTPPAEKLWIRRQVRALAASLDEGSNPQE